MNYAGMLRVKNEARWLARCIDSLQALCEDIYLLDDHSTDETREIARSYANVHIYASPFTGLDERRDKDYLLSKIFNDGWADYVVAIDGDEELHPSAPDQIRELCETHDPLALTCRIIYLWDKEHQWRVDGVYGRCYRPSIFRLMPEHSKYICTPFPGNLHCTNVPATLIWGALSSEIRIMHWGYFDRELRLRKYKHYNNIDPNNLIEDCYRHVIQGDPEGPPPHQHLKHAGPLALAPLNI